LPGQAAAEGKVTRLQPRAEMLICLEDTVADNKADERAEGRSGKAGPEQ
jgi:hypothetical protein